MPPTDPTTARPASPPAPASGGGGGASVTSSTAVPAHSPPPPPEVAAALARAAELLGKQQWAPAAELLAPIAAADASLRLQLNLARNMAALQRKRPATYQTLLGSAPLSQCRIANAPDGRLTVISRRPSDAQWTCLTPGGDPAKPLAAHQAKLASFISKASPIGVCGLGDGYVATWLAAAGEKPANILGQIGALYLLESDSQVVLHALMLHDLAGPDGPIMQDRCLWFIGPGCLDDYQRAYNANAFLPLPDVVIWQGLTGDALRAGADAVHARIREQEKQTGERIEAYYVGEEVNAETRAEAGPGPRESVAIWGDQPPRRPRVLIATSRFSRVLQHSARDARAGFDRMGCETRLLIEPTDFTQVSSRAVRHELETFRPDLVFMIDHLRYESGPIFPKLLPLLCWVQDDFPQLTSVKAGRSIGARDFVLTADIPTYVRDFAYPARQCIHLEKLTRVPERPAVWKRDGQNSGEDLAFVSNAARTPEEVARDLAARVAANPTVVRAVQACCGRMIETYQQGGSLHHFHQVRSMLQGLLPERGPDAQPPEIVASWALDIFNQLNNPLYRQQALAWIADAADALGLRLGLYGHGWESHPRFGPYARGPVAYGPDLEALARRTRINLQIVPYSCLHQRLLDGLVAGGFFLVRDHPLDAVNRRIDRFVGDHLGEGAESMAEARRRLDEPLRREFTALIEEHSRCLGKALPDLLAAKRLSRAQGLEFLDRGLPRLDEVSFDDAASVRRLIKRFIADEPLRREIATEQEGFVREHLTYEGGLRRVMRRVRTLLADEAAGASAGFAQGGAA
ncbi:MAG: hypothetical protein NTW19_17725 [Planctomycetota bacterium]|nr:hypothetical protein [Planctomycetota bacterium]